MLALKSFPVRKRRSSFTRHGHIPGVLPKNRGGAKEKKKQPVLIPLPNDDDDG